MGLSKCAIGLDDGVRERRSQTVQADSNQLGTYLGRISCPYIPDRNHEYCQPISSQAKQLLETSLCSVFQYRRQCVSAKERKTHGDALKDRRQSRQQSVPRLNFFDLLPGSTSEVHAVRVLLLKLGQTGLHLPSGE